MTVPTIARVPSPTANGVRRGRTIETVGLAEIAKPLPEVPYLIAALGIAPGSPTCIAGYGYGGKTLAAQSACLSIAAGRPLWGVYGVRRGRVLHLDYEQGSRLTFERYQRLAAGMGADLRELGDRLRVGVLPSVYLDSDDAVEVYARAIEGHDFVVVDSLRAAAPSADENSSEIRRHLDALARVSETTGAVCAFIHHARKPNADSSGGAKFAIRGSSAIFDGCASVFVFSGDKGQPTRVSHEKDRTRGVTVEDFGLVIEDVEVAGNPRAGLRVVHLEAEQLAKRTPPDRSHEKALDRLRSHFCVNPSHAGNRDSLLSTVGGRRASARAALSELESRGELVVEKTKAGMFIRRTGEPAT